MAFQQEGESEICHVYISTRIIGGDRYRHREVYQDRNSFLRVYKYNLKLVKLRTDNVFPVQQ